jgi:hypothetical protein
MTWKMRAGEGKGDGRRGGERSTSPKEKMITESKRPTEIKKRISSTKPSAKEDDLHRVLEEGASERSETYLATVNVNGRLVEGYAEHPASPALEAIEQLVVLAVE